ncbi:TPA: potassium-transporting ATPase subunit KdpB [Staphylococcus argenteus]|uniref:Potassium-transporting ATPase ATP-binding subunit n=2 Tax=Staphylococcus argenteus TaxID=985002 RepID=A0A7U7PW99_9STAP|nr:potassium-transporting ATPase subunit KdpB [Staphylococcus argenteus]BBN31612.1 P-ATPase superfamily P-type ATPase potassium (K+) transporter subunit B [Staphylococcus aureus]ATY57544.1 K(+)-transporting ATPase subunit B [Staphylococcus argenteus]ATZ87765.1 K(+)-transporting ATPase subunit B [Staphylococcus argenteus]EKF1505606.1 potassium-transporting ATPase subunit KdpB [Staphylococcus argenteus]EYG91783.1 potassium-transporting ATPase B chain 2 [Staphylococcus argenteus]
MNHVNKYINHAILIEAFKMSVIKLNPKLLVKNPIMFVVEIGMLLMMILICLPDIFGQSQLSRGYLITIFIILLLTILFANFSEAIAEGRGKAQADSLREAQSNLTARVIDSNGLFKIVNASELKKGQHIRVENGETIPADGVVINGLATVDESAITGESAPVIKESGGDFSGVIGGTVVTSDWLEIRVESEIGTSFLDKMIALVEGAERTKTPNEIALFTLLTTLTIIFLVVIATLYPIAAHLHVILPIALLIALTVCLIPTTIGGLLSAIGIAGMDRVTQFNVLAKSGRAVEVCGDVDVMILDKTGTITYGNRIASAFLPVNEHLKTKLIKAAYMSSLYDDTPEGKSIVTLAKDMHRGNLPEQIEGTYKPFTAETRMSGIETNGVSIFKGAPDSMIKLIKQQQGIIPSNIEILCSDVSSKGGTPLIVIEENVMLGVIYLKDMIKDGLVERFAELREMGIETVMCTGDNALTAATIAKEAGVDRFIAECKPEDKIKVIKGEQEKGHIVAMTGDGTNDAPALAQANIGLAMNSGTISAKEAANLIDLDSNPTKIIEVVKIGKQLLMTRGSLTTFSLANDIAKYFAILPALMMSTIPEMARLNLMQLSSPQSAIISALLFNALIIVALIPVAMKGVKVKSYSIDRVFINNMMTYGLGGIIVPFVGIKVIDLIVQFFV